MTTAGVYLSSGDLIRHEPLEASDSEKLRDLIIAQYGQAVLGKSIDIEEICIRGVPLFFLRIQNGSESAYQDLNQDPNVLALCKKIFKRTQPSAALESDDASKLRSLAEEVEEQETLMISFYERLHQAERALLSLSSRESIQNEIDHLDSLKALQTLPIEKLREMQQDSPPLRAEVTALRALQETRRTAYHEQYAKVDRLILRGEIETPEFRAERAHLIALIEEYRNAETEIKAKKLTISRQEQIHALITYPSKIAELKQKLLTPDAVEQLEARLLELSPQINQKREELAAADPKSKHAIQMELWQLEREERQAKYALQNQKYAEKDLKHIESMLARSIPSAEKIEEKRTRLSEMLSRRTPSKPFEEYVRFRPAPKEQKELIKEYQAYLDDLKQRFDKLGIGVKKLANSLKLQTLERELRTLPKEIEKTKASLAKEREKLELHQKENPALVESDQTLIGRLEKDLEKQEARLRRLPGEIEKLKAKMARDEERVAATAVTPKEDPKPVEEVVPPTPPEEAEETSGFLARLATGIALTGLDLLTVMAEAYIPQSPDSPRRSYFSSAVVDL